MVIKVCVAGLAAEEVELTLSSDNRFLTMRGVRVERDADKADRVRYHQLEVYYGPFERVVPLPSDAPLDRDKLNATYKDGFLKVVLPKIGQVSPTKIEIQE